MLKKRQMTKKVSSDTFCQISKVLREDIEEITKLEKILFDHPWTKEMFIEELKSKNTSFLKIKISGVIASYIIAKKLVDEVHILNIATSIKHRRKGLAKTLLLEVINFYKEYNIILEVSTNNKEASSLYKNLGFKYLYERKNYYPDGTNAIVMILEK